MSEEKPEENKKRMGRPLKFQSVEELEEKIQAYFESCWEIKRDMFGNAIAPNDLQIEGEPTVYVKVQKRPYTVGGLAVFLGCSRNTLWDYEKGEDARKDFSDTIKGAKDIIEAYAEEQLYIGKNQAGAIFAMKANYGWQDKLTLEGQMLFKKMGEVVKDDGEELDFNVGD